MESDDTRSRTVPVEQVTGNLEQGLYAVGEDGILHALPAGAYALDEDGGVEPSLNWQVALNKIPWDKLPEVIQRGQIGVSVLRVINLVGMYLLAAGVIGAATWLAIDGIIEGQAIVGFLGAAIGYLLSRGKLGN